MRGQQTFSIEGQLVNILGFGDYTVSVVTTHLCSCSTKAAVDNT